MANIVRHQLRHKGRFVSKDGMLFSRIFDNLLRVGYLLLIIAVIT